MVITITIIALVLILLTLTKILKEVSSINNQMQAEGVITDFWDKYNKSIGAIAFIILASFRVITVEQFEEVFGLIGELLRLIEMVGATVALILSLVRGWAKA